ncbi:MAG TPA: adenylate/guanylate cyclase domain-containing protein, partial [Myxococcaceae bacterium]|nr:adenylate/guanylate cyclase domain-containing protein [Myxococcaceae bacterium]
PGFVGEEENPTPRWRALVGAPVDALDRWTYDWRLRELGRRTEPTDTVVLVGIDDETLASAREDPRPEVSRLPWTGTLVGRLVGQLGREGASVVVLDPRLVATGPSLPAGEADALHAQLERARTVPALGFAPSAVAPPPVVHPLRPSVLLAGMAGSSQEVEEWVRRVLADRRPAYAVPDGPRTRIWAGVASEEEGRALARRWGLTGTPEIRDLAAQDRTWEVTSSDLLVSLAEVEVQGLDPGRLPVVRSLEPPPVALLAAGSRFGHTAFATDADGVVRGIYHLVRYVSPRGRVHLLPSLPLAAALGELGAPRRLTYAGGRLELAPGRSVPLEADGYAALRFDAAEPGRSGRGSLARAVSAWRLVQNLSDGDVGLPVHYRNDLERRVAILADTAPGRASWAPTPLGPGVAGAAVTGQSIVSLLAGAGLSRAPVRTDVLATFALAFLGAFLALTFSQVVRSTLGALVYVGSAALAIAAYLVWARHVFLAEGQVVSAGGPLIAFALTFLFTTTYALRTEQKMRDFVYGTLGRYVSPETAEQVFRNVDLMRPQRCQVTLAYADIEGFGALCQRLPPEPLVALLNAYFTELTTLVRQTGGQVEYVGDALIAFWGAPVHLERHAQVACRTALGIRDALERLQPEWERRFGTAVRCRLALHTGEVVAGDIGSAHKSHYSVLGEAVTVCARLEAANRLYGTRVLASAETARQAGAPFVFRMLDALPLGGTPEVVSELLARRGEVPAELREVVAGWDAARARYLARDFPGALAWFERHAAADPPSAAYAERCRSFLVKPPPPGWDGTAGAPELSTSAG